MTITFVIEDMIPTIDHANNLLKELGAIGRTTHTLVNSVEDQLSDPLVKGLRFLATTYNCAQHTGIESINVDRTKWLNKGEGICCQLEKLVSLNDMGTSRQACSEISYGTIVAVTENIVIRMRSIGATGNTSAEVSQSLYDKFNPPEAIRNALRNTFMLRGKAMHEGIDSPNFDATRFLTSTDTVSHYLLELEKVVTEIKPSIDTVMQLSIMIEKQLRAKGGSGLGINELTNSLESKISNVTTKKLHFIGKIRNFCAHAEHHLVDCSAEEFISAIYQVNSALAPIVVTDKKPNTKLVEQTSADVAKFWNLIADIIRAIANRIVEISSEKLPALSAQA